MLNKSKNINITQKSFLLSLYILTLGVFVPAAYWLINSEISLPLIAKNPHHPLQQRISLGDKILIKAHNNSAKQLATAAFAKGNYIKAQEEFIAALTSDRNDPEARIYLNNTIAAKTQAPYRIGVSIPIGGDLAVAEEILRGVAQAQEKINHQGGIGGKLLMVKIANDDNDAEIAREIAEQFIRDEQILAVVGHNSSNASLAAAPIYQEGALPMISPTSSAETLAGIGKYIFRTVPSTRSLADALAEYGVKTAGKTKIAICVDSTAQASVSFKENFTWSVYDRGGEIVPLNCDLSAADFIAQDIPSQAISQGAEALLLAPSVRRAEQAMAIVAANSDRLTLLGNHSLNSYVTLKEGQNDANGMVLAVAWHPQPADTFTQSALQLWGGAVNWRTAMAYDAVQTISGGLSKSKSRIELQAAISNPEFDAPGASSQVSFLPSGDRNLSGTLITIQPGEKSGTGFDFVTLNQQHPVGKAKSNSAIAISQ